MIDLLDNLIRAVLMAGVPGITDESQVRFQPPDDDWRSNYVANLTVGGQPANALNVYLTDIRENRKLRSNERDRTVSGPIVTEQPFPVRIDLHYLISAWSPMTLSPMTEPALEEHLLLYQSIAALEANGTFNPSRTYPAGSLALNAWPAKYRDTELPTTILPVEGFHKLSEFWHGMGHGSRWKPAIYIIITLPVDLAAATMGGIITTMITEYRRVGEPATGETLIQIGSLVLDAGGNPIDNAWVRLETTAGDELAVTNTDDQGRFTFTGLHAGSYQLRARAGGSGEITRVVDVPSTTGEYDLHF